MSAKASVAMAGAALDSSSRGGKGITVICPSYSRKTPAEEFGKGL
jgi:hypothetical protein